MQVPVYIETSHDLPLVSIVVGFRTGAWCDPPGKEGLTRLMVRMLRRGTVGLDALALESEIDRVGADFGEHAGQTAVTVSFDVIRRSFDKSVGLLCRILGESTFDEVELGKLVRETEGELIETRNNDRALCGRAFRRAMFEGHPFERRTSGSLTSLKNITREDVLEVSRRVFTQENMVLAFAGDIEEDEARRAAHEIQAVLPQSGQRPSEPLPEPVAGDGRRLVFVDKPERTQTQLLIGCLGTCAQDPDHIPLTVANTVFGGTFTSRLMREVRSKRGWSYGAYSSLPIDRCREAFSVWTHPGAAEAGPCLELELKLLEQWREQGISARELAFAKRYLTRSHAFDIDTASKRVNQKLAVSLYELPEDYYSGYLEKVRQTTLEQANQAIAQRLNLDKLVVAITGTHSQIGTQITEAIPRLSSAKTVPYDLE